jgi:pyruvate carboxylase
MSSDHGPHGAYSEVFEEDVDARPLQTVHRIRANSTIMQLKKILGTLPRPALESAVQ